ncbi:MAG: hypothetical protein AB7V14_12130 [Kiritimatiellia bacterium]
MSFMDAIKSLFTPAGGSARRDTRTYVVDGARLVDEKTGRRMAPRDQVQMLNALARVMKQEGLTIQAVFESDRPLREVEHGGEFNGVKVFYAPDNEQLVAVALKLCKSTGGTLVSSGVTMESRATEAGIPVLCSSTFRKAFLQGGMPGGERGERGERGGDRGDRGGRDRRRDRGPRRDRGERGGDRGGNRPPREGEQGQAGDASSEAPASSEGGGEESQAPREDNRAVRNLIDLVE